MEHKTNDWVRSKVKTLVGPLEPFLAIVKRMKLAWFGHFTRYDSLSGHLGGWATPWSAEEMLDGQLERVDIIAYATTVHNGILHKRLEKDIC